MITSSNGNIFRVTGPLWGEFKWRRALMFSLICTWTNGWVHIRDAGELRRHHAHYDVTVMKYYEYTISRVTPVVLNRNISPYTSVCTTRVISRNRTALIHKIYFDIVSISAFRCRPIYQPMSDRYRCHIISLRKWRQPFDVGEHTLTAYNYLSMLGLKLIHINKRGPCMRAVPKLWIIVPLCGNPSWISTTECQQYENVSMT